MYVSACYERFFLMVRDLLIVFMPHRASQARERLFTSSLLARFAAANLCHQWTPGQSPGLVISSARKHGSRASADATNDSCARSLWAGEGTAFVRLARQNGLVKLQRTYQPLAPSLSPVDPCLWFFCRSNAWSPSPPDPLPLTRERDDRRRVPARPAAAESALAPMFGPFLSGQAAWDDRHPLRSAHKRARRGNPWWALHPG